ncbi:MAG: DegT/DnrJ/EryC1/StrS family aminotransferase [Verrucomicrobia bacterium]|nr:DegT/DnrJ/EryC1/StrS family aminotransferase [Verrucomicrobiota bacterium]
MQLPSTFTRRNFIQAGAAAALASQMRGSARAQESPSSTALPKLARDGGPKAVRNQPKAKPKWGERDRRQVMEALAQPSLQFWLGGRTVPNVQTALLIDRFKQYSSLKYVATCSSGTAALHVAVAAAGIGVGDEVITTPIQDMGGVSCILFQQGVPVFADLEATTYNLDVRSVKQCITARTKAIIVVHMAGNPCDLAPLKALADKHRLILIEDCAIAWGTKYRGSVAGCWGHVACFSMANGKQIDTGEGGVVASSDPQIGPELRKFTDKGYERDNPASIKEISRRGSLAHDWMGKVMATNYRMTELQAALAVGQIERIEEVAAKLDPLGRMLIEEISGLPGIQPPSVRQSDRCSFSLFYFRLRMDEIRCSRQEFVETLRAEGVPCAGDWMPMPLYKLRYFQTHSFFAGRWPVKELGLTKMDYTRVKCPEAEAILDTGVFFKLTESMDAPFIHEVGAAIRKVATHFRIA